MVDPYARQRPALADRVQTAEAAAGIAPVKRKPGRPRGSKNTPKDPRRVEQGRSDKAFRNHGENARGTHRVPPRITIAEYAQAWEVYRVTPVTASVSDALGWTRVRANKLVDEGYPDWGMPALRERYRAFVEEHVRDGGQEEADVIQATAKEARELQVETLRMLRTGMRGRLAALLNTSGEVKTKELKDLWEIFEKAGRYISFAQGGADSRADLLMPHGILDRKAMLTLLVEAGVDDAIDVASTEVQPAAAPAQLAAARPAPEWRQVKSSNLQAIRHDALSGVLEVAFKAGTVYRFASVPATVFAAFLGAPSKGKFFAEQVKPRFQLVSG